MSRTSVAHAALMIALTPILVLLIAAMRGQEHLSAGKLAGMALAICGVGGAELRSRQRRRTVRRLAGDLIVFGASLCFALFTVFGQGAPACGTAA